MTPTLIASFVAAAICTLVGITLLRIMIKNWSRGFAAIVNKATWFFLSMVPPLILFAIDTNSRADGTISGFTVAGAFAAYVLTWWLATRWMSTAHQKAMEQRDHELNERIRELNEENRGLKRQIAATKTQRPLITSTSHDFAITDSNGKVISILEGSIENIKCVDLWVNSENTNMQMARFHDKSVSGTIRYHGANKTGEELNDIIADELKAKMGKKTSVDAGDVLVTSAGELTAGHNVKQILHVASVQGVPTGGYQQVPNLQTCVNNVLSTADNLNNSADQKHTSILFPLLGAGTAGADLKETAVILLTAVASRLRTNKDSKIERVCFIAPTDVQRDICLQLLKGEDDDYRARSLFKMVKSQ